MQQAKGFTLLEVMIAMAILASAMTVLMGSMANSNQQAVFSNELTVATMLARGQMIEIEYTLMREGFSNSDQRMSGNFREQGRSDIKWTATIEPVEIPPEAQDEMLAKVNSQLFGGVDGNQGALQGNAAFSSMLPTLIGEIPAMINRVGTKVRRVNLEVTFPFGTGEYPLSVTQYIVDQDSAQFDLFEVGEAPAR